MKTAILGGSFNPVHNGHLALADDVLKAGYERILFIPAAKSPLKTYSGGASDEDRLTLLKLALKNKPEAEIWDGEIRRGGVSYSIDTVKELIESGFASSRMGLVIGDDLSGSFSSWKQSEELLTLVDIVLARRISSPVAEFPFPCLKLNNSLWPFSSTEIRRRIAEGKTVDNMMPEEVADYILRNNLYAHAPA